MLRELEESGGVTVRKVVCPNCGGNLTFEILGQYGLQQRVSKTGKLCKRTRKVDYGSEEATILYCAKCKRSFSEDEYTFDADSVQLTFNAILKPVEGDDD